MKAHGYPIQTETTYNVYAVIDALKSGCDVERFYPDVQYVNGGTGDHALAVTSLAIDANGNMVTQEQVDRAPWREGGEQKLQVWHKLHTSPLAPYGEAFQSGNKVQFVIECPTEAPGWHRYDEFGDNFSSVTPSAVVQSNGNLAMAFHQSSPAQQVNCATINPKTKLPSDAVEIDPPQAGRLQAATSKAVELQDHRVAIVYQDSTPFDEKLLCTTSTDASCTAFSAPMTIDSGHYIYDLDAAVDPATGEVDVLFLQDTDPCVAKSTDAQCTAFTPFAFIQPFSYGLHVACAEDGAGGNSCIWEGSGVVTAASDVDFSAGTCANGTLYQVGTNPDDNCNLSSMWNPDSGEYDACYSTGTSLLYCYSANGQTWTQNNFYAEALPVVSVKVAQAALVPNGSRFPAVCSYEGLTLGLINATEETGHVAFGSRLVIANYTDLPAGSTVDMWPSPVDGIPMIAAQSDEVFRGYALWSYH